MTDCEHDFVKVGEWTDGTVMEVCSKCYVGKGIIAGAAPDTLFQPEHRSPNYVRYRLPPDQPSES